ncbi:MAG: MBL fold metallo-hydrolase [Bacteroidota bacterium]
MRNRNYVNISFVDVGQGDCIVLNWTKEDRTKGFGVIDCGNFSKSKYWFKGNDITCVDFVLVTHPHYDHYSGVLEMLNYFQVNNIKVKEIWLTFLFSKKLLNKHNLSQDDFLNSLVYDNVHRKDLASLLKEIARRKEANESVIHALKEKSFHRLNNSLVIEFLSPNSIEATSTFIDTILDDTSKKLKSRLVDDHTTQNPNANMLSSFLVLKHKNETLAVFTSDITTENKIHVFNRFGDDLVKAKLFQVPHHGSYNGFDIDSLDKLKRKEKCYAVISVGINGYDLPKQEVVEYYKNNFKELLTTNKSSEIESTTTNLFRKNISVLNLFNIDFSKQKTLDNTGTKSFSLSKNNCKYIR